MRSSLWQKFKPFVVITLIGLLGVTELTASEEPNPAGQKELNGSYSVRVQGTDGKAIEAAPVILRLSSPRGPFRASLPEPVAKKEALTAANGVATFSGFSEESTRGRKVLYAVVTFEGNTYYSALRRFEPSLKFSIEVPPQSPDAPPSAVEVSRLETIIQPWEDYLIFTQVWSLSAKPNQFVDTGRFSHGPFQKGMPIEMPMEAEGIDVSGEGRTEVVDNTVYWRGILQPERPKKIRIRYSIKAADSAFVFDQNLDYNVEESAIFAPLSTRQEKLPRLNNLVLQAPGFAAVEPERNSRIFRGTDVLVAKGASFKADDTLKFRLSGLPYGKSLGPWIATAAGFTGAFIVLLIGFRQNGFWDESETSRHLEKLKSKYLSELSDVEEAYENGDISEGAYEKRRLELREQLTLIIEKLEDA